VEEISHCDSNFGQRCKSEQEISTKKETNKKAIMTELPGLPMEVPQEYREQLSRFQKQIKILINNHQILVSRSQKNPQDKQVLKQIDDVKNYLISFSDQQRLVLDKVRSFLRNLEEERKKSIFVESQELGPPALPIKQVLKTLSSY